MNRCKAAAVLLLLASVVPARAQAIYRCPGGYSQAPCEGGTSLTPADVRTATQQFQSQANTQRDMRLAEQMEKERLKQEAQPASAYIPPPPAPGRATGKNKPSAEAFTAAVPGSAKAKKKPESGKKTPGQSD